MSRTNVPATTFIKVWQQAESHDEVAAKTGSTVRSVCYRASRYRKNGIPLKHMKSNAGRAPLNWGELRRLARECAPDTERPEEEFDDAGLDLENSTLSS